MEVLLSYYGVVTCHHQLNLKPSYHSEGSLQVSTIVLKEKKSKFSLSLRSLQIVRKSPSDLAMKWNWQVWPQCSKIYCHLIFLRLNYFQGIIIIKKPAFINTMEHFHCIIQLWYLQFCFYEVKYPEKIEFKNSLIPPHPLSLRKSYLSFIMLLFQPPSRPVPSPAPDLLRLQFIFAKSKHHFAKKNYWLKAESNNDITITSH